MRLLDTGEPGVEALKFESETLVVDPHTVQDGGVHVVDMHRVFDDVVAVLIGCAVDAAAFDAAASHPDRETAQRTTRWAAAGHELPNEPGG